MTTVIYKIPNISCNHCVHTIQTELSDLDGVQSVAAVERNINKVDSSAQAFLNHGFIYMISPKGKIKFDTTI